MSKAKTYKYYRNIYDYWNTNRETDKTLAESRGRAIDQQTEAFELFARNKNRSFAVFQIIKYLRPHDPVDMHIRSFSRAVTNLKNEGYINKLDTVMIMGHRGKMVHTYQLNTDRFGPPKDQLKLF